MQFSRFVAVFTDLLRFRRTIFSSGISKRSKRKNRYRLSSTRFRHRVAPGPNRPVEPANQRTDRAFQNAQEGQSFAARTAKDGLAATQSARLFEENRHPALPRSCGETWIAAIAKDFSTRESSTLSDKARVIEELDPSRT